MAADAAFAGYTGYVLQRTQTVLLPAAGFAAKYKIHKNPPKAILCSHGGIIPACRRQKSKNGCAIHSGIVHFVQLVVGIVIENCAATCYN